MLGSHIYLALMLHGTVYSVSGMGRANACIVPICGMVVACEVVAYAVSVPCDVYCHSPRKYLLT